MSLFLAMKRSRCGTLIKIFMLNPTQHHCMPFHFLSEAFAFVVFIRSQTIFLWHQQTEKGKVENPNGKILLSPFFFET